MFRAPVAPREVRRPYSFRHILRLQATWAVSLT